MRKTALFIVTEIDSASGICVQNVAKELIENKWNVLILTQNESKSLMENKDGIIWYTVRRHWSTKSVVYYGKVKRFLIQNLKRLQILLLSPLWPLYAPGLSLRMSRVAWNIAYNNQVDVVIPIYNTIDALIAGCYVKKKKKDIQLIPYFLDSLVGGQCASFMKEQVRQKKAVKCEKKIMSFADVAIMMNGAKKKYEELELSLDYLDKVFFLDIPMLSSKVVFEKINKKYRQDEIVFLFVGSMPRNIRSPLACINMFQKLTNPSYRLYFIGTTDYEREITIASGQDNRIRYLGIMSHKEAIEYMLDASFLINLGNKLSYMVPSKIFEYMTMQKPIISVSEIEDDPCIFYLDKYPCSLILHPWKYNAELIEKFVTNYNNISRNYIKCQMMTMCERGGELYSNTPRAFVDVLEERVTDDNKNEYP